jgi:hypothetical protein
MRTLLIKASHLHGIGAIEGGEPQNHSGAPAPRKSRDRVLRIEDRPVVGGRIERRPLVYPAVAPIRIGEREGLLDEGRDVAIERRRHQVGDAISPDAIVQAPGAAKQHLPGGRRHVRRQVDEGVVTGGGPLHGIGIEQIRGRHAHAGLRPGARISCESGDRVALRQEQPNDPPPNHALAPLTRIRRGCDGSAIIAASLDGKPRRRSCS